MRKFLINSTIGWEYNLSSTVEQIQSMGDEEKEAEFTINSQGGDVMQATAIKNYLQGCGKTIYTKVSGIAASAATIIYLAAPKERRTVDQNSHVLIHDPSFSSYEEMGIKETENNLELLHTIKDSILDMYEAELNISRDEISQAMDNQTIYSDDEIVDVGFASAVNSSETAPTANISTKFLNNFKGKALEVLNAAKEEAEKNKNSKDDDSKDDDSKDDDSKDDDSKDDDSKDDDSKDDDSKDDDSKDDDSKDDDSKDDDSKNDDSKNDDSKAETDEEKEKRILNNERTRIKNIAELGTPAQSELIAKLQNDGTSVQNATTLILNDLKKNHLSKQTNSSATTPNVLNNSDTNQSTDILATFKNLKGAERTNFYMQNKIKIQNAQNKKGN